MPRWFKDPGGRSQDWMILRVLRYLVMQVAIREMV